MFITRLRLQGLQHIDIEAAREGEYLPDLLCAGNTLQVPVPPLAPLLPQEVVEAPLALCFPLLGITLLQCSLFVGLLVLSSYFFYEFRTLMLAEEVAQVVNVMRVEVPLALPQDSVYGSGCLFLRREGGLFVGPLRLSVFLFMKQYRRPLWTN